MNVQRIGENAGIVWRKLNGENRKFELKELIEGTGLTADELYVAIGWLAREGKINIEENKEKGKDYYYLELNFYIG